MNKKYVRAIALIFLLTSSFNASMAFSWPSVPGGRYVSRSCAVMVGFCCAVPRAVRHRFGPIFKSDLRRHEEDVKRHTAKEAAALRAALLERLIPAERQVGDANRELRNLRFATLALKKQAGQAHQERLRQIAEIRVVAAGLQEDVDGHVGRFEETLARVTSRQQEVGQELSGFQEALARLERTRATQQRERTGQFSRLDDQMQEQVGRLSGLRGEVERGTERVGALNSDLTGIEKALQQRSAYRGGEIRFPSASTSARAALLAVPDEVD